MARLTLDWLHVVTLLGAIQGVFLAGVLVARRRNRAANRLLAALVFAFSLHLASAVYFAAGLVTTWPHFFGVGYPLPFLYGPLTWLYALTAADRKRRLRRRDALHFVPFAAVVVAGLPIYLMNGTETLAFYQQLQAGSRPLLIAVADPLKFVSGVSYAAGTLLFLRRHRETVKASYSSLERVDLHWLLALGGAAAFIWMLALAFQLLQAMGGMRVERADDYVALAIAVLVYAIGWKGLRQPEVFRYETAEYAIPESLPSAAARAVAPAGAPPAERELEERGAEPEPARYERSGLSDRQALKLRDALIALMETDRPWRESELTLADLAARLGTTPHKVSEVLNAQLGQSFYDFVNGYRVREVQRRIAAGDSRRLTMLSLALDAGFASKSTFNLVFKKHTGVTPSDYRQTAGV